MGEQLSLFPALDGEAHEGNVCEPIGAQMARTRSKRDEAWWPFWLRRKIRQRRRGNPKQERLPGVHMGPARVLEALEAVERGMAAARASAAVEAAEEDAPAASRRRPR